MDRKQLQTAQLTRKTGEKFFLDCFELYAMRQGKKLKDALPKGVDMKKAAANSFNRMSPNGATVTMAQFTDFLNLYEIEEVLSEFLRSPIDVEINTNVQMVDVNQFTNAHREGPKLVYREYPDD
eukprot:TRINITY_DN6063_c0_g1_i11.p1 TRINITY_DN6063_c0_g1~~TRINITY_DN6063_c0_g1_i11.p1  ORF type:complete len:124 (-),score=26.79 TRINITY_DN6063_c0_g1_i11:92-463(-)